MWILWISNLKESKKMQQVNQLNFLEKRELLEKYRSDLRKVDFERNYLTSLILQLETELQIPSKPTVHSVPKVQNTVANKPATRPYTKSNSTNTLNKQRFYGFKLSDWDVLMLETLENTTEPLNSSALLEIFEERNASLPKPFDDKQLRNALSRTVHKLANKKDVVFKETFAGKGFLYTLNPNYES